MEKQTCWDLTYPGNAGYLLPEHLMIVYLCESLLRLGFLVNEYVNVPT